MTDSPSLYAIIVAGGSGQRMGSALPKQFLPLQGKPLLWHSLRLFLETFNNLRVILVLPKEHFDKTGGCIEDDWQERITTVAGGSTRFESVRNGIAALTVPSIVFVHDAVRCLATPDLLKRCYQATLANGNAIPAVAPVDSLRLHDKDGYHPIPRSEVILIQTPQTFLSQDLVDAFQQDYDASFTDEATVVEKSGLTLHFIDGESDNIKITRATDLLVAEAILKVRMA